MDKHKVIENFTKQQRILKDTKIAKVRLEYLREQINNENISYGELAELQSLVDYIKKDDVQLLEWAGVKEVI